MLSNIKYLAALFIPLSLCAQGLKFSDLSNRVRPATNDLFVFEGGYQNQLGTKYNITTSQLITYLNTVIAGGGGGSATNLTPWTSDIDAAGFALLNAGGISVNGSSANEMDNLNLTNYLKMINVTASKIAIYDGLKLLTNSTLGIADLALSATAINTTGPLAGGGDLTTSRTLTVSNATTAAAGVVRPDGTTITISSGVITAVGGGGGGTNTSNWTGSGTTNSTLAGNATAETVRGTNGVFGPYNAQTSGNVLKQYGYIYLPSPRSTDGAGCTFSIPTSSSSSVLSVQGTYSTTAATNGNQATYHFYLPEDFDSTVELVFFISIRLQGGADPNQEKYSLGIYSPADGEVATVTQTGATAYVLFNFTAAAAASSGVVYNTVTATGFAAATAPGRMCQVFLARDGTDASTVASATHGFTVRYGKKSQ